MKFPSRVNARRCAPPLIGIMGYYLQAFIGRKEDLLSISKTYVNANLIELNQGIFLIPFTEFLFDEINSFVESEPINHFQYLTNHIESRILATIGNATISYVEAEYHSGQGGQKSIVWKNGERLMTFQFENRAINKVLKYLGVISINNNDEFDSIGLGNERNTKDWISNK